MTECDTVLVTGAFGQVGSRCTAILLERGHAVVALDLHDDRTVAAEGELSVRTGSGTLITAYVDLLDADALTALVVEHAPRAIVHLAAILAPACYRDPRQARRVNVGGTANVVSAACQLPSPPLIVYASSAGVYGSRNPHRFPERITAETAVNPVDQYGEDKVRCEQVIRDSAMPFAILRLAGVISPDGTSQMSSDHLVLMRAAPGDNRMHTVDARDVALAFAHAVERRAVVDGKVLLIGGNHTHLRTHREMEDDMVDAVGVGRLGAKASLPGDPDDDHGWSFTGWFDTTESQELLGYQQHDWRDTASWAVGDQKRLRPVLRALRPVLRPLMRLGLAAQRRVEKRGPFADPWSLIGRKYGSDVLAPTDY